MYAHVDGVTASTGVRRGYTESVGGMDVKLDPWEAKIAWERSEIIMLTLVEMETS